MDPLIVKVDAANKQGVFLASSAVGVYDSIALQVYGLPASVDMATLTACIYLDNGQAVSTCGAFSVDQECDTILDATMSLATDTAVAFFSPQSPHFMQDLTFILSDKNQLYCNSRLRVKNNPNAIPQSPTPITQRFVLQNASGFTVDLGGETPVTVFNDEMTAGQVRVGLLSLVKYLQERGVL